MKEKTDFAGLPAVKVVAVAGLVIVAGLLLFSAPASTTTPQQGAGALVGQSKLPDYKGK